MELGLKQSLSLSKKIISSIKNKKNKEYILFPSFSNIYAIKQILRKKTVSFGAQDCSQFSNGAVTGDVSASMLKSLGCKYVILGHSERRTFYKEDKECLKKKIIQSYSNNLKIIFCVGETIQEYKAKKSKNVVRNQLSRIFDINLSNKNFIIAYEPVWAIGSSKTPGLNEIEKIHKFIKDFMKKNYKINNITVLYGGSLNPKNSKEIFLLDSVDGGLVGGSSLNASNFIKIYDNLII